MSLNNAPLCEAFQALGDAAHKIAALLREQTPATDATPVKSKQDDPSKYPRSTALSYSTGRRLSENRAKKRMRAIVRAGKANYNFRHWCETVRSLRLQMRLSMEDFGSIVGVSSSSIDGWESGISFPRQGKRDALEQLGKLKQITPAQWRKPYGAAKLY